MILHWRQALTSSLVAIAAALVVDLLLGEQRIEFSLAIGLAVGASRLIELPRR